MEISPVYRQVVYKSYNGGKETLVLSISTNQVQNMNVSIITWRIYLGILIVVILSSACIKNEQFTNTNEIVIPDNQDEIKSYLSEYADTVWYVYLEDCDSSYIGQVSEMKLSRNYIIIYDKYINQLSLFTSTGAFLRKIGKQGGGPGEYGNVFSFDITKDESLIYVYAPGDNILVYGINGIFKESIYVGIKFRYLNLIGNKVAIQVSYPISHIYDGYSNYILDQSGQVVKRLWKKNPINKNGEPRISGFSENYLYQDTICYWEYFNDTIYGLSKDYSLIPRWAINLGPRKLGNSAFQNMSTLGEKTTEAVRLMTSFAETTDFFFLELVDRRKLCRYIYLKNKQSILKVGSGRIDSRIPELINDLDNGPNFWSTRSVNSSVLVKVVEPSEMITLLSNTTGVKNNSQLQGYRELLTIESNPTLMFIKMKSK